MTLCAYLALCLPGSLGPTSALETARDGSVWFGTMPHAAPQVALVSARLNGTRRDPRQPIAMTAGAGELTFAGTRREAFYTNIPPGPYRFRVRAANEGHAAWSQAEAAVDVELQPRFYQTGSFLVIAVAGVLLVLISAHRWRLRMLREQQGELMRLVRERTEQLEDANRKLAQMSYVDAITEVSNRRSFEEELTMEWRRSARSKSRLSLLMVDIDGFKAFNDALGHQAGDEALKKVAAVIDLSVRRAGDVVARYGGEEFAVLLPDTEPHGASALAERIRLAIEERNIWHPATQRGRLTVSIGVATMMGGEEGEPSALVRAADDALYQAKRDGRNLVRVAEGAGT